MPSNSLSRIIYYASEPFAGERYIASLPPLKKGDRGGFSYSCQLQIPPAPPFSKGGNPRPENGSEAYIKKISILKGESKYRQLKSLTPKEANVDGIRRNPMRLLREPPIYSPRGRMGTALSCPRECRCTQATCNSFVGLIRLSAGIPSSLCNFQTIASERGRLRFSTS